MKSIDYKEEFDKKHPRAAKKARQDLSLETGITIEVMRIKRGMTQKQLAKKIGAKQPSIARAENGNHVSTRLLERIAKALGFSIKLELRDERTKSLSVNE